MVYNLYNGIENNINNLLSRYIYYLFISATQDEAANIYFKIDSMNNIPFNNFHICEYSNINNNYDSEKAFYITFLKEKNEFFYSFNYTVSNEETKYIAIKIKPNYDINYIIIKFNVQSKQNIENISLTIILIISLFFILVIIIFIILCLRKRKKNNNVIYMQNENKTPLTPLY